MMLFFFLLSVSFAKFLLFLKFSFLCSQAGVQVDAGVPARGQRGACAPLIRCNFVLPCCSMVMPGNPSAVLELQFNTEEPASPHCSPTPGLFCQPREMSYLLRINTGIPPDISAHTTGNCSEYYCSRSKNIHVSSAGKPNLSGSPVLDVLCSLTSHHFILSCHSNCVARSSGCTSSLMLPQMRQSRRMPAILHKEQSSKYKN